MTDPKPERLHDVMFYEIGVARQGGAPAIAVRFHLRDGATFAVAIPADQATGLAIQIADRLRGIAGESPPSRN